MPKKKSIPQPEKNKGKRLSSQEPIDYDNKPPIYTAYARSKITENSWFSTKVFLPEQI